MNKLLVDVMHAREQMYRFLGGFYIMEVDGAQMEALKRLQCPTPDGDQPGDADLSEGYHLLGSYVSTAGAEDLENLAADYAKVFLAAGDASGRAAFPYESVYVDKRRQIGGSTEMQMKALYRARGWESDPNVYRTMEDNIGLMLEYMGILCAESAEYAQGDDEQKISDSLREQQGFVKAHLANWVSAFTADVFAMADTDFYKGVAKITSGFIRNEQAFLRSAGV